MIAIMFAYNVYVYSTIFTTFESILTYSEGACVSVNNVVKKSACALTGNSQKGQEKMTKPSKAKRRLTQEIASLQGVQEVERDSNDYLIVTYLPQEGCLANIITKVGKVAGARLVDHPPTIPVKGRERLRIKIC